MQRNKNCDDCHEKKIKVIHKGVYKETKVCLTCNIVKPFRSHHCSDCDNCIIFCPDSSVNKQHDINYDYCKGCGICANECPSDAIEMVKE